MLDSLVGAKTSVPKEQVPLDGCCIGVSIFKLLPDFGAFDLLTLVLHSKFFFVQRKNMSDDL